MFEDFEPKIDLYTDGGCVKSVGGWGVIVLEDGEPIHSLSGGDSATTNNRMELTAAIKALEWANHKVGRITIHSDSKYVLTGIKEWVHSWRRFGWQTYGKQPVKNRDLWERLYHLVYVDGVKHPSISWEWVKGHSGNVYNEQADALCTAEIQEVLMGTR